MNITLNPEREEFLAEQIIKRGHYKSHEEVIGQNLEFLRQQEEFIRQNLEESRKEIDIGIKAADRGELVDGEEVFLKSEI